MEESVITNRYYTLRENIRLINRYFERTTDSIEQYNRVTTRNQRRNDEELQATMIMISEQAKTFRHLMKDVSLLSQEAAERAEH